MGRRSFPGGIITSTEPSITGYGASGMWTTQTAAQKKNSGFWPIQGITPSGPLVGPTIANVSVTDSSYTVLNDTPYINSSGGYIKVTGTGFASGAVVYVGGSAAVTTSFINSTEVRAQVAAGTTSNAFPVYVVNSDSSVAIKLAAVTYSGSPSWSTSSSLTGQATDTAFSIALSATSDSSITYSLAAGSSLPPGTSLSSNGVFSGTVAGTSIIVDTVYSFDVVANDAENQDTSRTFTVTVTVGDPFFYLTPLLLNGEATTWVTDASDNKVLSTISGDTKPTAFSPYNTSWGAYFNGSTDYLSSSSTIGFGTGPYSVEFWFFGDVSAATYYPVIQAGQFTFYFNASVLSLWNGPTPLFNTGAVTVVKNAWNFVQVIRTSTGTNGTTLSINGVSTSGTDATNWGASTFTVAYDTSPRYLPGYLADFRISNIARTVGVPTSRLTSDANTLLLTCQNNRFIDNGPSTITITRNGSPSTKSFGPFAETDTTTGSAYFDGTGDYITRTNINFSTNPFTIEGWFYPTTLDSSRNFWGTNNGAGTNPKMLMYVNASSQLTIDMGNAGSTQFPIAASLSTNNIIINQWHHIALVRSDLTATGLKLYVNGVLAGTGQLGTNLNTITGTFNIGYIGEAFGSPFVGYINDFRINNGTAVYTGNFTPPTSILGNTQSSGSNIAAITSGSTFLSLQYRVGENNHRFIDESGAKSVMIRAGNATQGTFSPFSPAGWSGYFDGSTSYLNASIGTLSGTWTVEFWVNMPTLGVQYTFTNFNIGSTAGINIWRNSSNQLVVDDGANAQTPFSTVTFATAGVWYHVAVTRDGTTTRGYINGVLAGTNTFTPTSVNAVTIGRYNSPTAYLLGYMSNLRVVDGVVVYTGAFTPPTSALTATQSAGTNIAAITAAQTLLLALQNNRFIDANTTPKTITVNGTPRIQAFNPLRPSAGYNPTLHSGSAYFDGSGDAVYNTTAPVTNFGTGDFTVDYWVYPTVSVNGYTQHVGAATTSAGLAFGTGTGMALYATTSTVGIGGNLTVFINQWNHIAWTRQSGFLRGYVNGAVGYSASFTTSITEVATSVGAATNGSTYPLTGYISDVRVLKGNAQYTTSTFTVPTSPSSLTPNVSLKLSFTQGGMVDATARNSFETLGDVRIVNTPTKFGSGALYFDGTGDYLKFQTLPQYTFGTGDFTFECWIYLNSYNGTWGSQLFGGHTYAIAADYVWYINTTGKMTFQITSSTAGQIVATSSVPTTTWTHIALVRSGGTVTPYINGTSAGGAASYTTALTISIVPTIGADSTGDSRAALNGYIDDFRISRYARYTTTFTAPTSAFQTK